LLFLAVLVGVGGSLAIAAVAGARRSDHVLPRFLDAAAGPDAGVLFAPQEGSPSAPGDDRQDVMDALASLRSVTRALRAADSIVAVPNTESPSGWSTLLGVASIDAGMDETVGHPIMVAGRLPAADAADEIAINEEMAARHQLEVGDLVQLGAYSRDQFGPAGNGAPLAPAGLVVDARVTGIVRYPADLLPVRLGRRELSSEHSTVYMTPAWWKAASPDVATYGVVVGVWTRAGDVSEVWRSVAGQYGGRGAVSTASIGYEIGHGLPGVRRAISIERLALIVFGALGALATTLLFAQTLSRRMWNDARTVPTVRALGMTNAQVGCVWAVTAILVAVVGAMLAMIGAVALSPALPIGVSRRADLDVGVHADWLVLGVGAAVILIVVLSLAFVLGHSVARRTTVRGDRLTRSARAGGPFGERVTARLPVTAATGARFAASGMAGLRAVPAVATVAAVGAVCAAATFTSSLDQLSHEPSRYGAVWDVSVGNYADEGASLEASDWLAHDPDVETFAGLQSQDATVDGHPITVIIAVPGRGIVHWPLLEGHAPVGPDEIALGSNTLDDLHKRVGDSVTLASEGGSVSVDLTIVGRTVLAPPDVEGVEPGRGALVDATATAPFERDTARFFPADFVITLREGADVDAAVARLHDRFFSTTTYPAVPPNAVLNVERVSRLPVLLAALVAALAGAVFVHTLSGEIRQRRKELAVLKTIGLRGTQVSAVLAWQVTVVAIVGVVIGVPVGILAGRAGWRIVSAQLGVEWSTAVPMVIVTVLAVGALLLANIVALGPGLRARRARPAAALRTE
jgi:hypothetical protein